jgi:adenylyltransferase/sulfurtransferase
LIIRSERRTIAVKGRSFRKFLDHVVPLLDGAHTLEEIRARVAHLFEEAAVDAAIGLLASHGVLEDGDDGFADLPQNLRHQWNFFHELGIDPRRMREKLNSSTVAIFGLGPLGGPVAASLAAAGIGNLRCFDHLCVDSSDVMLNPLLRQEDVGQPRTEAIKRIVSAVNRSTHIEVNSIFPESEDPIAEMVQGADFTVCCADAGLSNLFYKLNRVCLKKSIPWTSGSVSGFEGVAGPTVTPGETACYLCYQMRAVGCAENPEEQFAHLKYLDGRKRDDGASRENLVFGVGVIGHWLGLEAFRALTGVGTVAASGRVIIFDFVEMTSQKHVVLRKPWCPACGTN